MRNAPAAFALCFLALAGCNNNTDNAAPASEVSATAAAITAKASLNDTSGKPMGMASLTEVPGGLRLEVSVERAKSGRHGIHLHMTGRCEGPKFESAGAHWNPDMRQHGLDNPKGFHAGDMPNIAVAADGTGRLTHQLQGTVAAGLLDADGSALVVHAGPDDQKSDPSGNSGDRVACGVFAAN